MPERYYKIIVFVEKIYLVKSRVFRFLISGSIAATVNLGILYLLVDVFGIWYLSASVIAFSLALIVSFTLQKFITFSDHRLDIAKRQFFTYSALTVVNLIANAALMYFLTDGLGLYYIASQVITSGLIAVASFFVYSKIIFNYYA